MKMRGIIAIDYGDISLAEAGLQEQKLKEICEAIKLTTPSAVFTDAMIKPRRGDEGLDLSILKFRTS